MKIEIIFLILQYPLVALLEGQIGGRYPPFYPLLKKGRKKRRPEQLLQPPI